jgi:flagellar hook-length control protein FliK
MSHLPILSSQTPNSSKIAAGPATAAAPAEDAANGASPFGEFLAKHLVAQGGDGIKADVLKKLMADRDAQVADPAATSITTAEIPAGDLLSGLLPQDKLAALAATANAPTAAAVAPIIDDAAHTGQNAADAPAVRLAASDNAPRKDAQPALGAAAERSTPHEKLPATAATTAFAATLQAQNKTALRANIRLSETAQPALHGTTSTTPSFVPALNMAASAHTAAPAQATVQTPVGQPQWANDFSQKVTWIATQRSQSAELHLNPAQLGPLEVSLKLNGDQATLQFTSAHAAVRDAIEQSIPRLRDMLADSGISLGNTTVSDQAPREQQQRGQAGATRGEGNNDNAAEAGAPQSQTTTRLSRHDGMVDTFV